MASPDSKSVLWAVAPTPSDESERVDEIVRLSLAEQDLDSTSRFGDFASLAR